jgi:hypothetical protein
VVVEIVTIPLHTEDDVDYRLAIESVSKPFMGR